MPPRIPTAEDFEPLSRTLPHVVHFPDPPESTTAILVLLHGLGDSHAPFASFASAMNLPGVLCVSVRGTSPLPMAGEGSFHWGDDMLISGETGVTAAAGGGVDEDPGFKNARDAIVNQLVQGVLVDRCGWEKGDVMFFGFGQGGSLGLGIGAEGGYKGVVSVGGSLPLSMLSSTSSVARQRGKSGTPVLAVQLGDAKVERMGQEFAHVEVVRWKRTGVGMPSNREEMFPIMKFFADRLKAW
ncbi:hypothetical protein N3K66_006619 [Trichothecium roseum]|uniref:Uncharacterized protein n=1 Tax=Trichothecium roseum TaxID=47278 RepID=A0ACC0UW13_9HYPO|nr:hypothetical protein N3K66_006619 [Trichothecium roseum]